MGVKAAIVNGEYLPGDISISDGLVDQVGLPPGQTGLAIPGFVDLQVMGFGGVDFTNSPADGWEEAGIQLASTGVTSYLANLISNDAAVINNAVKVANEVSNREQILGSRLRGVHLEGPFLAKEKAGIHSTTYLRSPEIEFAHGWLNSGPVSLMTVAPELPGALELISWLTDKGVVVSLGHSNGTSYEAAEGFDAGATAVTHIFNAMSGITARSPGLASMAFLRENVWIQLILDLLHVDKVLVQLMIKMLPQRIILVTDCLPVTGTSIRKFNLSGTDIELINGMAVSQSGVLAGSVLTMDQALRNAIDCGMHEVAAVNATSLNPLRLLNDPDQTPLSAGSVADVVVMSEGFEIETVFCRGSEIERARLS